LKNDPIDVTIEASNESIGNFISNVAVMTGIGAGINYQLNNNFSLLGTFDLNRSSDAVEDIYQIHKLFYHSSHSVNSFIAISFGVSYSIDFAKHKKSTFYKPITETDKLLIQSKITRKKGNPQTSNNSIWYDDKKGM
jgi:hypothetical protein